MKKRKLFSIIALSLFWCLLMQSCDEEDKGETLISEYGSDESHKAGQDCMSCHLQGGEGEGWFTVAGTVYDSAFVNIYKNATVKLYSEPNGGGSHISTIEVDEKGNFYTTKSIDFTDGLYTYVEGDNSLNHMYTKLDNGKCNSCHGTSTSKIWTK